MGHDSIIDLWPSVAQFARDIGVDINLAYAMKRTGSIAPWHWPEVVRAAARRHIRGVTYARLAEIAAAAKRPVPGAPYAAPNPPRSRAAATS